MLFKITILYFNIFYSVFYFCAAKADFSDLITPVFSVT